MSERLAVFNATEGGFGLPTGLPAVAEETTSIYALNCPVSGRLRYVGKSDKPKDRLGVHLSEAKTKQKRDRKSNWLRTVLKAGHRPLLEVLDSVPKSEWPFWEKEYVRLFKAIFPGLTNTCPGGESFGSGKDHPLHGKPPWNKGKNLSAAQCKQMSLARKGRTPWNKGLKGSTPSGEKHWRYGKETSKETRERMSIAQKGSKHAAISGRKGAAKTRGEKRQGATSNFRGVCWVPRYQKWMVQLRVTGNKNARYIGRYASEQDAARAYDAAAKKYFGAEAKLNFPNE